MEGGGEKLGGFELLRDVVLFFLMICTASPVDHFYFPCMQICKRRRALRARQRGYS